MEGASESMLNTTDDDNRFSAGVKVDTLKMLHAQSSNVLGKEFDGYLYLKGFSVRKDDLHRNKQGLIIVCRWVCSK
ncbi:hypothetical protein ACOSQ2_028768 [Xanthoceras sorbifolium]